MQGSGGQHLIKLRIAGDSHAVRLENENYFSFFGHFSRISQASIPYLQMN